tara:strand:- start:742 stop:924 length:183 start_codon:yes stop_codon:yes gene_type:complete
MITRTKRGFDTEDGYAAIPWGHKLVIVFNGEQLIDVKNQKEALQFIKTHRTTPKSGTIFV